MNTKNLTFNEIVDSVNKELENKVSIEDVMEILDITNSISDEFKDRITENQYVDGKPVYCIVLKESITDAQLLEYLKSLIITDKGIFLFYNKDMWID